VAIEITFPLLNPNEPEALLAALYVSEGGAIAKDDLLCTLETTKSTADVHAEAAGFLVGLQVTEGQTVNAGDLLGYLADTPEWVPPEREKSSVTGEQLPSSDDEAVPDGLRITQPALALARDRGLPLSQLPVGPMITEGMIRSLLKETGQPDLVIRQGDFDPMGMIIYGGGGHGKACLDLVRSLGTYRVVAFVDDGISAGEEIMGLPVLGGGEMLADIYAQGVRLAVNAVGGIGNVAIRIKVFGMLAEAGFACPAVVHPTAFVEASAALSPGVQVFPHAYVGSEARVGFGGIINTGAIISHDCDLGEVVNISPGAILAGEVQVGPRALIGMGVTVNLQARIGAGARIGNGATVKSDVPENGVVRAGGVWPA
jgi:sugar O-acyltransferase (sialic acid O-acetyltransferase NeuD family)